jgi:hypothetical protein
MGSRLSVTEARVELSPGLRLSPDSWLRLGLGLVLCNEPGLSRAGARFLGENQVLTDVQLWVMAPFPSMELQ